MELGLKNKSALVLASSSGLGKAIAMELAREGARVMLCGRSEEQLKRAQQDILNATGNEPKYLAGLSPIPGISRSWSRPQWRNAVLSLPW